ncbi:MAG: DUF1844 domain-containing protein [Deltaproteobacteria bacterium]|nr:DUF1844 domain-containing protein [Deltaproteobacteria bacterium]
MSDNNNQIENKPQERKIEFKDFIASLYMSAVVSLGLIPDPITNEKRKNISFAQETIEILRILKEKTRGNLTEEESKFLDDCTYKLMLQFVDAIKEGDKKA